MNKLSLQITILFIITWLNGYPNFQQPANYRFQYLKVEDGLPQNTINAIAKDAFGFMWFGTNNGICRFDGYSFETFKSDKNNLRSLPDNMISSIEPGNGNRIWIGSSNGLSYYDPATEKIRNYHTSDTMAPVITKVSSILSVKKEIWVATSSNGIFMLAPDKNGNYAEAAHYGTHNSTLTSNSVNCLSALNNSLVAGTTNGLFSFDPHQGRFTPIYTEYFEGVNVNDIFQSSHGDIYISTFNGLAVLRSGQQPAFYTNNPLNTLSISHNTVNKVIESPNGEIFVGSLGGLQKFNLLSGSFYNLPETGPDYFKLNNQFINTLYCDKEGNVWIGTDKGGVNKFNVWQNQFGYYTHDPDNTNSINVNTINSIYKEKNFLWIGTAGGGLNMVNLESGLIRHFTYNINDTRSISNDYVTSFARDNKGSLWVGTWGGGLNHLSTQGGNVQIERLTPFTRGISNTLVNTFVSALLYDKEL
jgi:ligand-binding sensor domain-containing protein